MAARKPHNRRARLERACRALLSTNHVAVISLDPAGQQFLINWKSGKRIASRSIVDAVCDIPHRWCIYLSALCVGAQGERYIKSVEAEPNGIYLAAQLTDVIETCYRDLLAGCNAQHVVASGWIANPCGASLDEAHAARIFEAAGAWPGQAAA